MKVLIPSLFFSVVSSFAPSNVPKSSTQLHETKADLEALGTSLNPVIGYYDPLGLSDGSAFWGQSNEFTIGFLRQAEIKHGRVAMAAFVGYCVQSNFHWPWAMTRDGMGFPGTDLSPPEQWDAIPFAAKLQIIGVIGFLEWYSELTPQEGAQGGQIHYTKGGTPGKYPSFDAIPHAVPFELYDPFRLSKNMSDEDKERRLQMEINNGRLAMIGIFGFLSAQTIPGSVPALGTIITKQYTGEVMAPFSADFSLSPF